MRWRRRGLAFGIDPGNPRAMRPLLLLPFLCLFAMPPAMARQQDDGTATMDIAAADARGGAAPVDPGAKPDDAEPLDARAASADGPRSGFGQVMSVLTGLLQDAAQREATGHGDGFALDNPAIEISVTPVEGQTSLLRTPAGRDAAGERRSGAREPQLAAGTPR